MVIIPQRYITPTESVIMNAPITLSIPRRARFSNMPFNYINIWEKLAKSRIVQSEKTNDIKQSIFG
jgi:hypothetical protein